MKSLRTIAGLSCALSCAWVASCATVASAALPPSLPSSASAPVSPSPPVSQPASQEALRVLQRYGEPVSPPLGFTRIEGDTVYVTTQAGAIEAHSLATGELRWRRKKVVRPLGLYSGHLVAQAAPADGSHTLVLVLLDPRNGDVQPGRFEMELPPWASPTLQAHDGYAFRVAIHDDGTRLLVAWSAQQDWILGPAPPPDATKRAAALFEMNLEKGSVQKASLKEDAVVVAHGNDTSHWLRAPEGTQILWQAPDAVVFARADADGQHVWLRRGALGSRNVARDVELVHSVHRSHSVTALRDGKHIVVWQPDQGEIYSIAGGTRVGVVPGAGRVSAAGVRVLDNGLTLGLWSADGDAEELRAFKPDGRLAWRIPIHASRQQIPPLYP